MSNIEEKSSQKKIQFHIKICYTFLPISIHILYINEIQIKKKVKDDEQIEESYHIHIRHLKY